MFSAGKKPIDRPFLRYVAEQLPDTIGIADTIEAEDGCTSGRRREKRDQRAERGALTRAVRPQKAEDFTGLDLEGKIPDGVMAVVGFGQMGDIDGDGPIHHPQPFAPWWSCIKNWMRSLRRRAC